METAVLYLISYDLQNPGKDYSMLTQALGKMGARRVLLSEWLLVSNEAPDNRVNTVARYMDANDRLLVTEITRKSSWTRTMLDKATLDALFGNARS